jgi:hypothetical protein
MQYALQLVCKDGFEHTNHQVSKLLRCVACIEFQGLVGLVEAMRDLVRIYWSWSCINSCSLWDLSETLLIWTSQQFRRKYPEAGGMRYGHQHRCAGTTVFQLQLDDMCMST